MTPDRPWQILQPSPTAIRKWTRRNHPFVIELGTAPVVHDATLQPFHRTIGWDKRCKICQRAKAYVKTLEVHREPQ